MTQIKLKRVYEDFSEDDGFRVLVDRLWPRGIKKEYLHYDLWAKNITPSPKIREWFHEDIKDRWHNFTVMYEKELSESEPVKEFIETIKEHKVVTLLYASREPIYNHANILKSYLEKAMA
ncbi:MAG: DUF488 family protein [Dysgonomonas sp.]|nr:DUF488 family protein [Dysgonomonas sp.]